MPIDVRHLRYFIAVAEELHFGRAARRLLIAQPPLSQTVRQLEDELGVRLLERNSRRVALTEAGRVLLHESRRLLADLSVVVEEVRRIGNDETLPPPITIGFVPALADSIAPFVHGGRERMQRTAIAELQVGSLLRGLRDRTVDIGFLYQPVDGTGIDIEPLGPDPLQLVVWTGHRLAGLPSVTLAELTDDALVELPRTVWPQLHDLLRDLLRERGACTRTTAEATTAHVLTGLVAARVGVGILPGHARTLAPAGVEFLPITDADVTLCAARPAGTDHTRTEQVVRVARRTLVVPTAPAGTGLSELIGAPVTPATNEVVVGHRGGGPATPR